MRRASMPMEPSANWTRGALIVSASRREPLLGDRKDKDRYSEQLASDDFDRAADREGDVNASFSEVQRDLGA
jgi:hypothetical protein